MVVLSFHNIFERLFETFSSQVKIHLQLREEDGVLRSIGKTRASDRSLSSMFFFKHNFEWFTSKLLTSQMYKHYGHFLIKKQIRFHKRLCNRPVRQEGVWQLYNLHLSSNCEIIFYCFSFT